MTYHGLRNYTVVVSNPSTLRTDSIPIAAVNNTQAIRTVLELFPDNRIVSVTLDPDWHD